MACSQEWRMVQVNTCGAPMHRCARTPPVLSMCGVCCDSSGKEAKLGREGLPLSIVSFKRFIDSTIQVLVTSRDDVSLACKSGSLSTTHTIGRDQYTVVCTVTYMIIVEDVGVVCAVALLYN